MEPVFWLCGMSGCGKTTLAKMLVEYLFSKNLHIAHIDGDIFRKEFNFTGFSPQDRMRNIDAMREYVLKIQSEGTICIVSAITPYSSMRERNREMIANYNEIWVKCAISELVRRDTKGLYALANKGELANFTGISDKFENPEAAALTIDTTSSSPAESFLALKKLVDGNIEALK